MKLLVIDIQKGITDSRLFNFDEFIDNTSRIIQAARDNQIEVIYFQHDDGPGTGFSIGDEEFEIAEQVHPREGEKIFTKNINSCFGNKDFTDYVKDENTLMIVGLQTNFCIDATVKSAFERQDGRDHRSAAGHEEPDHHAACRRELGVCSIRHSGETFLGNHR
mgnify:CR=1 FL=1